MVPVPGTGSNVRSVDMQFTQVAYGGCWKCPHAWQRCSASTPCLAASQKGCVHAFGTGMGLVTLLQSFIVMVFYLPSLLAASLSQSGISHALFPSGQVGNGSVKSTPTAACPSAARALPGVCRARKRERRQLGRRQARCTVTPLPKPRCRHLDSAPKPDMNVSVHPAPQQRGVCHTYLGNQSLWLFSYRDNVDATVAGYLSPHSPQTFWAGCDRLRSCHHP